MKTENAECVNASQAFYFSLANLEVPKQLLGEPRAILRLKMNRRFKIAALTSSMATFLILSLAFGHVLGIF